MLMPFYINLMPLTLKLAKKFQQETFDNQNAFRFVQIPLVIFKREKRIARELEKNHVWVSSKLLETWEDWWDQIVVGASTFPRNYWDKRVKQRVFEELRGEDRTSAACRLGMKTKSRFEKRSVMEQFMETL